MSLSPARITIKCANIGLRRLQIATCLQTGARALNHIHFGNRRSLHVTSNCRFSDDSGNVSTLFVPVPVKLTTNPDDIDIGAELTSVDLKEKKDDVLQILNKFYTKREMRMLGVEQGLDAHLFHQAFISFRRYVIESEHLPADLHIILSDILSDSGHIDDIFPYYMRHAKQVFPMLDCMDDLKKISDLTTPANLYQEARAMKRKIIFHAGPTNSGKTYQALERFYTAKSGVYCGPLKLLANEVHQKSNARGTMCDLVTGEERKYAHPDGVPSNHVACTVEMTSIQQKYEVAVIDEIQMLKDAGRGWAWTRALLGVCADEIHVCGEAAAIDLVNSLMLETGEDVEINRYERLTPLTILDEALVNLDNVQPGDCIVAFSKNDIYKISRELERKGKACAVIYGSLPPGTKLAQAQKFNDPDDPCKILVATDAVGMGLNLSIKRIIFNSVVKPTLNEKGEIEIDRLTTSQALQIAGRAGRYGSKFADGEVTTLYPDDLPILKEILDNPVETIEAGGLHPTAEQIELFAYQLPDATFSNLVDIFVHLSEVNPHYFVCNLDDFKFLADMIQHIPLALRARYTFCCAPINRKHLFVCTSFLKFARQYSRNDALTFEWLCKHIRWPLKLPMTIKELMHLEAVHDVLDLYLWFSYRFMDMFPEGEAVRQIQQELDYIIQEGVLQITRLIQASAGKSSTTYAEDFEVKKTKEKTISDEDVIKKLSEGVLKKTRTRTRKVNIDPEGLSSNLIKEGILSREMVQKLHAEWEKASDRNEQSNYSRSRDELDNSKSKKNRRKKRK